MNEKAAQRLRVLCIKSESATYLYTNGWVCNRGLWSHPIEGLNDLSRIEAIDMQWALDATPEMSLRWN